MSSFLNYMGMGGSPPKETKDSAVRALPGEWYTSTEMYDLERRAIFSRKWQLITHKTRLQKAGDYLKFNVAEYEFILARDRDDNINGFHNVCRHRAFPVVTEKEGSAKIFSCKYHGWSYGLNGKLAKAPGYQELSGFQKENNGLLPIHTRVDRNGFIWVNLDGKQTPELAWEEELENVDAQERYQLYNFEDYEFDHFWEMDGAYNWKILADNYNECYHCATTHPDIPALADLKSYNVKTSAMNIVHDAATTDEQRANGLTVASTYYFPNVSTNISPHFFMIQRFVPNGPVSSSMQYQVFRNKNSTDEQFELVNQIYKRIMSEDKYLCEYAQKNINAGVFVNGEMHPRLEKGPLYFQKLCRDTVTEHHAREKSAKKEIWPAKQQLPSQKNTAPSQKDLDFCAGLTCPATQEGLAW